MTKRVVICEVKAIQGRWEPETREDNEAHF